MIELTPATRDHIRALFPEQHHEQVATLLANECGDNLPLWRDPTPEGLERIRFGVLKLSEGDTTKLDQAIALAKSDWRDLLMASGFGHDIYAHKRNVGMGKSV